MSDEINQADEQAFDALLAETLGGLNPPDLSGIVLDRLESDSQVRIDDFVIETALADAPLKATHPKMRWSVLTTFAAVAATLLWLMVGINSDTDGDTATKTASDPSPTAGNETLVEVEKNDESRNVPDKKPAKPLRGIPLLVDDDPTSERSQSDGSAINVVQSTGDLPGLDAIARDLHDAFFQYWDAVGVEPTKAMSDQEATQRLAGRIDLRLPEELLGDPDGMQVYFTSESNAAQLASAWLRQITREGVRRISEQDRESLNLELAKCIEGSHSFDRTLLSWIEGQNPRSAAFHQAMGSPGKVSTVNHLAKLTMNVDLRCVRCHDSKIDGNGQQAEYWQFAALLKSAVPNKSAKVNGQKQENERKQNSGIFYELTDGRQRLAEPGVSPKWVGQSDDRRVQSVKEWADALSGSKALAHGVVNSLWEFVYGMPLDGRVVDPVTAPHDAILESIEERLARDLIQSNFNIARTLALVIAAPVSRRSVPEIFGDGNSALVSSEERAVASDSINAFAASAPVTKRMTIARRVDQAARSIGVKIDATNPAFVAQANNSSSTPSRNGVKDKTLSVKDDFPTNGEQLPVQWLKLLPLQQSRLDHLAYLAGYDDLPSEVRELVEMMEEDTEKDRNLTLQRVWWMIRP